MLNFWRNNRQKDDYPIYKRMATAPKTRTLTGTRVRGCWSCCSRAAETTSWKSRSKMGLNASFQLVENVLNTCYLVTFLRNNHV